MSFLAYLKRLQTNIFCDIGQNQYRVANNPHNNNMLSVGIDLTADINILRIAFPFNLGIRTVYVPETKDIQPSLLMSVSFY